MYKRQERIALATLGHLVSRVERAMATGAIVRRDPFQVAMALWACQHGMVSLEARAAHDATFEWDVVAPLASAAMARGFAVEDG